jgi:hypothetical protein
MLFSEKQFPSPNPTPLKSSSGGVFFQKEINTGVEVIHNKAQPRALFPFVFYGLFLSSAIIDINCPQQ